MIDHVKTGGWLLKLKCSFWGDVTLGTKITFVDDRYERAVLTVQAISHFNDFGDAWFVLQNKIGPHARGFVTMQDARDWYAGSQGDITYGAPSFHDITYEEGVVAISFMHASLVGA